MIDVISIQESFEERETGSEPIYIIKTNHEFYLEVHWLRRVTKLGRWIEDKGKHAMTGKKYTTRPFKSIKEMLISHKKKENVIFTYKKQKPKNEKPAKMISEIHINTDEPTIVINGKQLTNAQSMTVRVALESFYGSCTEHNKLPGDNMIFVLYQDRIDEIRKFIYE